MSGSAEETYTAEEAAAWAAHGIDLGSGTPADTAAPAGADTVSGTDSLAGGGSDALSGGQGADTVAAAGQDTLTGGQGADAAAQTPPTGFVPHAALHQERMRANALTQQMAQLTARTNALLTQQRQAQLPAMPQMEQDPIGYIEALQARLEALETGNQQQNQHRDIETRLETDENIFQSYTADYTQASEHYARSRASELLMFYPPEQVQNIMRDEVRNIAEQAWQRGMPAAQAIYQLAKTRGYAGPAAQTAQPAAQPGAAPAQAAQPAQAAAVASTAAPTPAAIVASVQQGQQASRSLSSAGGAAANELNAEALLKMSDEEFEQVLKLGTKGADARFAAVAGR